MNINKGKRMCLTRTKASNINHEIVPSVDDKNITAPRCWMDLSTRYWRRVIKNYNHINSYTVTKINKYKIVTYDNISYGSYIKLIKKRITSQ